MLDIISSQVKALYMLSFEPILYTSGRVAVKMKANYVKDNINEQLLNTCT